VEPRPNVERVRRLKAGAAAKSVPAKCPMAPAAVADRFVFSSVLAVPGGREALLWGASALAAARAA
jgi:hypothetical protein